MSKFWIAPSILSADFARLGKDVQKVLSAGCDIIHFDVMDNHYVPNLTFGPYVLDCLKKYNICAPIDVHLMIKPVDNLIPVFAKAGASIITFHPESSYHVDATLNLIKYHGCKCGLVFNPTTSLDILNYVINKLDVIVLMGVNPGFSGQKFIPSVLKKIVLVKKLINNHSPSTLIEVDGGINIDNIKNIADAGANIFVMGSTIFGSKNYKKIVKKIKCKLNLFNNIQK